ncbi:MAG: CpXC domain-containing protein [Anaerolineae bacterium]|nr:CpXC domain-containing protein [Anaerolineae bacterium]
MHNMTCPNCSQPFSAILEQVIDVGSNPQAKLRLLNNELNVLTCPHCGFQFAAHAPLIYHDGSKELLVTHVPMELSLSQPEQERIIGQLQQALINSLPPEQRRGYMFTPKRALTLQSLIDQILDADGITAEVRQAHRARLERIEMLLETPEDQLATAIQAHDDDIDAEFFQALSAAAQLAAQRNNREKYEKIALLYDALIEHSTVGREIMMTVKSHDAALAWAQEELQALGEDVTREQLIDLVVETSEDDQRISALVSVAWPLMDYQFFQRLTEQIQAAPPAEQSRLEALRARLNELAVVIEQQNRAALEQAANVLRALLQAPDLDTALARYAADINEVFLSVLIANLQAAEQAKDISASAKLKLIYERVMALFQAQSPPEVQFLNALLNAEDDAEAYALIDAQAGQFGPELLELMDVLIDDLKQGGRSETSERLGELRGKVEAVVSG